MRLYSVDLVDLYMDNSKRGQTAVHRKKAAGLSVLLALATTRLCSHLYIAENCLIVQHRMLRGITFCDLFVSRSSSLALDVAAFHHYNVVTEYSDEIGNEQCYV